MSSKESIFPTVGLMPKDETQASSFIKDNPTFDGRGVIVAIFDSGVDPCAPGLQITSDGKPKIIDIIDGTGSGDVDTSVIREITDDNERIIEGVTGRKLKLGNWPNPTGKWHVGVKSAFSLFTSQLSDKLRKERRKEFDIRQRETKTALLKEIESWNQSHKDPSKLNPDEQKTKKDLDARLSQLEDLEKNYNDPGPIYDCVVFHDGEHWNAVIDKNQDGQLENAQPMVDYDIRHQYDTFSLMDLMNFVVHIYDDGNILSIVTDCSPHGTHVAGIVGAYHPDQPELNGVAPGVQLISVKIGDHRLSSEETGPGVIRGLIAAKKHRVDLINMSYGEAAHRPNVGRVVDLINEFVIKHKIIYISSAGNNGPALSTVGAPGGTSTAVMGVAAAVTPDMMPTEYSLRDKLPENMFTWSSRGPAFDGHMGVSLCAPGGAFAPVPNWTLKKYDHMNGTSMSSPNCCGGIALLLSALRANNIPFSPNTVRTATENTARYMPELEHFAQGYGMLQVANAYEYFMKNHKLLHPGLRYEINIKKKRGIFLTNWIDTHAVYESTVTVTAVWHEDVENPEKIQYERRFILKATQPWIHAPQYLVSITGARNIAVKIDPTRLAAGQAYYGEIQGIDAEHPELGPLFRVPISVIKPWKLDDFSKQSVSFTEEQLSPVTIIKESNDALTPYGFHSGVLRFKSGTIHRNFMQPPSGATSAELTIKSKNIDTRRMFLVHTQQKKRHIANRATEMQKYFFLTPTDEKKFHFKILDTSTLEIALAQFWSSLGETEVEYTVQFHGVKGEFGEFYQLNGNEHILRVDIHSAFRNEDISPSVKVDKIRKPMRPTEHQIKVLSADRDALPDQRQILQLGLTYKFKLEDKVEDAIIIVPKLSDLLYESPFECQFWMIFDANKQLVAKGDAYSERYTAKLNKGDYTLRLHVRHENRDKLEKLKDSIVTLEHKLSDVDKKGFDVKIFSNLQEALTEGAGYSRKQMKVGKFSSLHLKAVGPTPKVAKPGDILTGSISFQKDIDYLFHFNVPAAKSTPPSSSDNNNTNSGEIPPTEEEKMRKHMLNQAVTYLGQLVQKKQFDDFNKLSSYWLEQNPDHLPLLQLKLHAVDNNNNNANQSEERLDSVVAAADVIINTIDRTQLAIHYGTKFDSEDSQQAKLRKDKDAEKEILIDALYRKGLALLEKQSKNPSETVDQEIAANNAEFRKWVDADNTKFVELEIKYYLKAGHLGLALQSITKQIGTLPNDDKKKQMVDQQIEVVQQLGWSQWVESLNQLKLVQYPSAYSPY